jgi:hypothetical protein
MDRTRCGRQSAHSRFDRRPERPGPARSRPRLASRRLTVIGATNVRSEDRKAAPLFSAAFQVSGRTRYSRSVDNLPACRVTRPRSDPDGSAPWGDDEAARKMLGCRGSRVFPAPSRPALVESSRAAASAVSRTLTGRGLPKRSWAIAPKNREVDALLAGNREARAHLREVQPEVCFSGLNGGRAMIDERRGNPKSRHRRHGSDRSSAVGVDRRTQLDPLSESLRERMARPA